MYLVDILINENKHDGATIVKEQKLQPRLNIITHIIMAKFYEAFMYRKWDYQKA